MSRRREIRTFVFVLTETVDDYGNGPEPHWGYTVVKPGGNPVTSMSPHESYESCLERFISELKDELRRGGRSNG